MRAFIDTNIFVYATYPSFSEHEKARGFLKACLEGSDSWFLSWGVIYEYLRVVNHAGLFSREVLSFPKAVENVLHFASAKNVDILTEASEHANLLSSLASKMRSLSGNLIHDAHHVLLMREHDLKKIFSADTDLNRFQGLEVVNPLRMP
jgi:toxin-antitoxin system PIN domain toxin